MADLTTMMDNVIGIQSGGTIPNDGVTGGQPGVTITAGGQIQIVGNQGTVNDLDMSFGDLTANTNPVNIASIEQNPADGESTITDFVVFDSLGTAVTLKMSANLEDRTTTSTTYRWYIDSTDDSSASTGISTGTITFDGNGHIVDGDTAVFNIQRDNTAANNMQITIDFTQISGISSTTAGSTLNLVTQDGSDPGTLTNFVIDETGAINGVFDNGIIRTLGQIVMARFANPQGLVEDGQTTFRQGVSSGSPFITTPGNFGAGTLRSGSIELSNTDIGRNLVDLIVASTNYRGNARVISSVQQLVDELLVLGR
jgi:flagellar hook protein FlgE